MKKWPRAESLSTKVLQFMDQEGASRWTQLESLAPNKSREVRSARIYKVLNLLCNNGFVEKITVNGRPRYVLMEAGRHELEHRRASNLLAMSAPFYIELHRMRLVCFGDKIAKDDEERVIDVFRRYPRLKAISCVPPLPLLDTERIE